MASRSSNRAAVPEAKGALDKFKYEVANELGVPLSDGYNGDLTSKQNGRLGLTWTLFSAKMHHIRKRGGIL